MHPSSNNWFESSPRKASMMTFVGLPPLPTVSIAQAQAGLDSTNPNVIVQNFQVVLQDLQAARGIHGELHVQTLSCLHWFFNNAADQDNGLYQLVLHHSRFSNDLPFLTIAQHAGYAPPFNTALEPPLHRQMSALDTALPYHGAGKWEDTVPAFPSLDSFTRDWEELMVSCSGYRTFLTR
ncbi:hypothetical protein F5876DRAFT_84798 [Lentinula aff. lateritia]|uniref:Uncharacterized protein n=1 Tax=Lentinula aff. lateritia TaxID=2804960 RepID=A0ACC1TG58_9AGAR|nr:hypothetical protein F5876DRAFT_84798 [Lentinula aff. lateritia]